VNFAENGSHIEEKKFQTDQKSLLRRKNVSSRSPRSMPSRADALWLEDAPALLLDGSITSQREVTSP
jgi:hypothetical protein